MNYSCIHDFVAHCSYTGYNLNHVQQASAADGRTRASGRLVRRRTVRAQARLFTARRRSASDVLAAELLVVALLNCGDRGLEALRVDADHGEDAEVRRARAYRARLGC